MVRLEPDAADRRDGRAEAGRYVFGRHDHSRGIQLEVSFAEEARVNGNSRFWAATLGGAVVGAIAGYMFFTEDGRTFRRQLEPMLDDVMREMNSFRHTVEKAAHVAGEGWKLLNEALGEADRPRYVAPHQSTPF
jgi:hypothetical protein